MVTVEITIDVYNELRKDSVSYGKLRGACSKIIDCWLELPFGPGNESGELDSEIRKLIKLLKEEEEK